jgi:DNA-binding CsgD family transcriptional regulator
MCARSWGRRGAHLIERARGRGRFTERLVKGLGGKQGKPVPLIHSWKTLDPSGPRLFSRPDPLWGSLWEFLPDMIPDDFEQTLVRRPRRRLGKLAVKREGIFLRMMNGWTIEQIGLDLKISRVAVRGSMAIILRQEGVKNRHELAAKLGWKHEQPLNANERVLARAKEQEEMMLPMLLAGLSRVEMAERMRLPVSRVVTVAGRIYRRHGIGKYKGRRELARKVGVVSSQ